MQSDLEFSVSDSVAYPLGLNETQNQSLIRINSGVFMARVADRERRMRQDIREKIQATTHLNAIMEILNDEKITSDEVAVKKLKLDGHFKILDKVLPNLKQVELSGELNHTNH